MNKMKRKSLGATISKRDAGIIENLVAKDRKEFHYVPRIDCCVCERIHFVDRLCNRRPSGCRRDRRSRRIRRSCHRVIFFLPRDNEFWDNIESHRRWCDVRHKREIRIREFWLATLGPGGRRSVCWPERSVRLGNYRQELADFSLFVGSAKPNFAVHDSLWNNSLLLWKVDFRSNSSQRSVGLVCRFSVPIFCRVGKNPTTIPAKFARRTTHSFANLRSIRKSAPRSRSMVASRTQTIFDKAPRTAPGNRTMAASNSSLASRNCPQTISAEDPPYSSNNSSGDLTSSFLFCISSLPANKACTVSPCSILCCCSKRPGFLVVCQFTNISFIYFQTK